jgi:ubiquinone/menaquinone biosynthesis C-methylase UbiE
LAERIGRLIPAPARQVLEVGCGEGSMLPYLRNRRPDVDVVGLDLSQEKVRFLRHHCEGARVTCGDALQLPFAAGQFDAVLYRDVLHHVNWAREQVLAEGWRVLRPGGVVIVLESDGHTVLNRLFQWLYPAERGLRDSTRSTLMALGCGLGSPSIEFVEASFLVRAVGFVVGWPRGLANWLVRPLYAGAICWERLVEWFAPRRTWTYMMMSLRRA